MSFKYLLAKYQDIFFHKALEINLHNYSTVLDVACGAYSPLRAIKKTFYSEGIDIFKPYVLRSKKLKIHDKYTLGDITKLYNFYKKKSFDAVICLDVIEHFTKPQARKLITSLEEIAQKRVILMTPNGFYHQDSLENNPHQEHKSGWNVKELQELGYRVFGLRGLKYIRGEHASIKYKPWFIWGILSFISEPVLYFYPQLSYQLFAIKNVDK